MKTIGVLFAFSFAVAMTLFGLLNSDHFQLFGEIVDRVNTKEKVIALTFDDGPTPDRTREILDILDSEKILATFFLNGKSLERYPEVGRLLVNSGHEIGNHSYSHKRMVFMPYSDVAAEIESTTEIIREFGYTGPLHFRPPFGKKLFNLPLYLRNNHIKTITWDVEPETWSTPPATVEERIERGVSGTSSGSIILMHVMHGDNKSMAAVKPIIVDLKSKGYKFVTVSQLLRYQ
jgi:peptidoglycan/xylan/chitin deacetylase (PgdA/CDA1 family)